jgi:hypothetical protein
MALGIGLVSAWLTQQWAEEREHALALQARITELEKQLAASTDALEGRGTVATDDPTAEVSATPDAVESADQDWSPSGQPSEEHIAAFLASREQQLALYEDPAYREAGLRLIAARFRQRLAALRVELRLPPDEFDRVLGALAQAEMQQNIYMLEASIAGTRVSDESLDFGAERLYEERERAVDLALRDALGDARYRQWNEYQRNRPAGRQLDALQEKLEYSGSPLGAEQRQAMMPILSEAEKRVDAKLASLGIASERPRRISDMDEVLRQQEAIIEIRAEIYRSTAASVADILTPAQHQAFIENLDRELELRRAQLLTSRRAMETYREP